MGYHILSEPTVATLCGTSVAHERRNRRRERPGSRKRRTLSRKGGLQFEYDDGLSVARDKSLLLPSDYPKPSPLLRQNFDQSWRRWKAREAEEEAEAKEAEAKTQDIVREQHRLFGGEVDDDELRVLGILYESYECVPLDSLDSTLVQDSSPELSLPTLRTRSPSQSRRASLRNSLPLSLSLSCLSNDLDIVRLMTSESSSLSHNMTTQNRGTSPLFSPQSLPPVLTDTERPNISSPSSSIIHNNEEFLDSTWSVINSEPSTPISEGETWIILGDDS